MQKKKELLTRNRYLAIHEPSSKNNKLHAPGLLKCVEQLPPSFATTPSPPLPPLRAARAIPPPREESVTKLYLVQETALNK